MYQNRVYIYHYPIQLTENLTRSSPPLHSLTQLTRLSRSGVQMPADIERGTRTCSPGAV